LIRLQHRLFVRFVEVRPHAGGAGEVYLDARRSDGRDFRLEVVGGGDHLVRAPRGGAEDDRGVAVARDRADEASVGELTETLGGSQQNISKHLSALLAGGFVARRKQGTSSLYRIADPGVHEICEGVCAGIETQLAELEAVLGS
jgi:DNA-binding transcriptional ArsR family regulator